MNIFRFCGDLFHTVALVWLISTVWRTKSTAHISGKSQILYLVVYMTRYMDLFSNFVSLYNSVFKVLYILLSAASVSVIYYNIKNKRTLEADSFRMEILIIPTLGLALAVNHEFSIMEVLWTFSIYLEAVAMIPQMFLMRKTGGSRGINKFYLPLMGSYRFLYILNWMYRFYFEGFYDVIAIVSGVTQTVVYIAFFLLMWWSPVTMASVTILDHDYQEVTEDVFDLEDLQLLNEDQK